MYYYLNVDIFQYQKREEGGGEEEERKRETRMDKVKGCTTTLIT